MRFQNVSDFKQLTLDTMERWVNKVAVVTGASAGIGAACARALLEKGMIVVGLARRQMFMDNEFRASLPEGQRNRFYAIKCDLCLENDIRSAFAWIDEHLAAIHVLINNAGIICHSVRILDDNSRSKTSNLRASIDVNVRGIALCARETFQLMKRKSIDGQIVFINNITGRNEGNLKWTIYSASKFALTALIEVLRQEVLHHQTNQIKVTNISPRSSDTIVEMPSLPRYDVIEAILYCLKMPENVQIHEIIVGSLGNSINERTSKKVR